MPDINRFPPETTNSNAALRSPGDCRPASEGPFPSNDCQVGEPRETVMNHWTYWTWISLDLIVIKVMI